MGAVEQSVEKDKKSLTFKEKQVNVHRVIALKKQFKQQVQDRLQMLGKLEQTELEQEKSKYLKKDKKKNKKEEKLAKTSLKKRKHKEMKDGGKDVEEGEIENGDVKKKQKRMSLYGL